MPPPLPIKHRDSDYSHLTDNARPPSRTSEVVEDCYQVVSRCMPVSGNNSVSNTHYEVLEIRNREVIFSNDPRASKKSPPTPPPKPARTSRGSFSP